MPDRKWRQLAEQLTEKPEAEKLRSAKLLNAGKPLQDSGIRSGGVCLRLAWGTLCIGYCKPLSPEPPAVAVLH